MSEYVRQNITYHCKNSESELQIKTDNNKVLNLKNNMKLKTIIKEDECMVSPQQLFLHYLSYLYKSCSLQFFRIKKVKSPDLFLSRVSSSSFI